MQTILLPLSFLTKYVETIILFRTCFNFSIISHCPCTIGVLVDGVGGRRKIFKTDKGFLP